MSNSPRSSVGNQSLAAASQQPQQPAATYTQEELSFHKLFPQVPLNEKLVENYQCGLSRNKIVRMGRLYVTPLRLCFHSTFMKENLMIEWENVEAVEKKENFVFEAIVVKVARVEYYFSAFMGITDQAHKMVTMLWSVRKRFAGASGAATLGAQGATRIVHQRTDSAASTGSASGLAFAQVALPEDILPTPAAADEEDAELPVTRSDTTIPGGARGPRSDARTPALDCEINESNTNPLTDGDNGGISAPARDSDAAAPESGNGSLVSVSPSLAPQQASPAGLDAIGAPPSPVADPQDPSAVSQGKPDVSLQLTALRASGAASPAIPDVTASFGNVKTVSPRPASPIAPAATPATPLVAPKPTEKKSDRANRVSLVPDAPHDVLRHFPNVPKTETVVDSFQCSYVVGVHRLGKLYITANYILFTSVMLSEGVSVKFSDIASIEKEQTMVILDGVTILTKAGALHSFTSFVNRDSAFSILQHFFAAHRSKQVAKDRLKSEGDAAAAVQAAALETPGATAVHNEGDTSAASPSQIIEPVEAPKSPPQKAKKKSKKPKVLAAATSRTTTDAMFHTKIFAPSFEALPVCSSIEEFSKVATDFGTGLSDVHNFLAKQIVADVAFPKGYSVLDIFKHCFDDDTTALDLYHEQRQDTARTWEPWRAALPGSPAFSGQRKLLCTTIIRAVMAKACPFTEFQRCALLNVNGSPHFMIQFSGQAVGVMFSDSFRAETLLVFSQPNAHTPTVTLKTYGYIQFLRSVWVRGKILSTALDVEMPECYKSLASIAVSHIVKFAPMRFVTTTTSAEANDTGSTTDDEEMAAENLTATGVVHADVPALTPVPAVVAATQHFVPTSVVATPAVAAAAVFTPSDNTKMALLGLYSLALWYTISAMWATFWVDASAARVQLPWAVGSADTSLASSLVVIDAAWLVNWLRPCVMVVLLLVASKIIVQLDKLMR